MMGWNVPGRLRGESGLLVVLPRGGHADGGRDRRVDGRNSSVNRLNRFMSKGNRQRSVDEARFISKGEFARRKGIVDQRVHPSGVVRWRTVSYLSLKDSVSGLYRARWGLPDRRRKG